MGYHLKITKNLLDSINALEEDIGIPKGFIHNLLQEDYWSFIIKLHSFFEAAVSHLLIKALEKDELKDVISSLELSNSQHGKLAFARSLKLLNKDEARYIKKLSELRNLLVHNVVNVNFNLETYVNDLDVQQFSSFVQSFGFSARDDIEIEHETLSREQFIKENPRLAIWIGALACLDNIYHQKTTAELKAKLSSKTNELLEVEKKI